MVNLKDREKMLLHVLIEEHIATGKPVSSKNILQRGGFDCSSATIRNDLVRLESMGFVEKPHSSSGRIPTEMAYKLYAADVVESATLDTDEKETISRAIGDIRLGVEEVLNRASRFLSEETKLVSLVISTMENRGIIASIDIVPITNNELVIILVTKDGNVISEKIHLQVDVRTLYPESVKVILNNLLAGKSVEAIDSELLDQFFETALSKNIYHESIKKPIVEFLSRLRNYQGSVVISHGLRMLIDNPEFAESRRLKAFLRAQNEEDFIKSILTDLREGQSGVKVVIGRDNIHKDLNELSIVFTNFALDDGNLRGRVGVVGPTRMPYSRIVPLVDHIAQFLTEKLGGRILVR